MKIGYAGGSEDEAELKAQVDALREYGCAAIYEDRGFIDEHNFSGSGLQKALGAVTTGSVLVVKDLSCLGPRSQDVAFMARALMRVGAHVEILRDHIETAAAGGFQVFRLMLAYDELERRAASRTAKLRFDRARQAGTKLGSRPALDEAKVERARQAVEGGRKVADVAAELEVSPTTVYRAIKGDAYAKRKERNNLTTAPALTAAQEEFVRKEATRGRKNREIAIELGVSTVTVRRALKRMK